MCLSWVKPRQDWLYVIVNVLVPGELFCCVSNACEFKSPSGMTNAVDCPTFLPRCLIFLPLPHHDSAPFWARRYTCHVMHVSYISGVKMCLLVYSTWAMWVTICLGSDMCTLDFFTSIMCVMCVQLIFRYGIGSTPTGLHMNVESMLCPGLPTVHLMMVPKHDFPSFSHLKTQSNRFPDNLGMVILSATIAD